MKTEELKSIFDAFNDLNILVIGDVMIDAYYIGKVDRISPEAPVPVVHVNSREKRPGGAANVGLNLRALGANTIMAGVVGADDAGRNFIDLLNKEGIDASCMVVDKGRPTTQKTRIISGSQQMLRVDEEIIQPLSDEVSEKLFETIKTKLENGVDVIIFEDYNKGVLTKDLIENVIAIANEKGIITCVDPKKENFFEYKNVTLFKPNLKELREGLNIHVDPADLDSVRNSIVKMEEKLGNKYSLVTLSQYGVFIKDHDDEHYEKAHVRNISDVSGAGDTVISVAACCLAKKLPIEYIAGISNLAGGLVCEETGVVPINKTKLLTESVNHFCA